MKKITLNIGGQYRDFFFGLGFLGNLLEKENIEIQEIQVNILKNAYKWMPLIMFHSLSWGYIKEGREIDFTYIDVADWIDEETEFDEIEVILKINEDGTKEITKAKLQKVVNSFFTAFWASINKNVPAQPETKKKVMEK